MARSDHGAWMWADAVEMLARAERLQSQFGRHGGGRSRQAAWEPPIDVLETDDEVLILVALPGVDLDGVEAAIEDGALLVVGHRVLPPELGTAVIHRLELPQGRFERRIPLPPGRYGAVRRAAVNGCLLVALLKAA